MDNSDDIGIPSGLTHQSNKTEIDKVASCPPQ